MALQAPLESLLSNCEYNRKTKSYLATEIKHVIKRYRSLQVQLSDGILHNQSTVILCLNGTIPVTYKGSIYNIPVRIIYPDTYPSIAPIARVIPTPNMFVKPSMYVDEDGTVKLNILNTWHSNHNTVIII
jgi:ESCRT-I complex subunit TSG101